MREQEMTEAELKDELFKLLDEIDLAATHDIKDITAEFNAKENISYIFYIRITEIFQAILSLIQTGQAVSATILLRAMAEAYILMKASMHDNDFNDRHISKAATGKAALLSKVMTYLPKSGFKEDVTFFEGLKAEAAMILAETKKGMQTTNDLFFKHDEHMVYLQIYTPASLYVHSDRQSFNIYHGDGNSVKPVSERDLSGLYRHTGMSAALLMLRSYELFCELLKKESSVAEQITLKMDLCAAKLHRANE